MPHAPAGAPAARIADIRLDGMDAKTCSPEIEMERHRAISDLLADNSFRLAEAPENAAGPYRLRLALTPDRMDMQVTCATSGYQQDISLPLSGLRRHIGDYVILCDNFYKTARTGERHRLEAIDAGRRSIHDEGAELLGESLKSKAVLDKMTARRLFSLLYVLHMRNTPTII